MENKKAKIVCIVMVATMVVLYAIGVGQSFGIYTSCPPYNRFLYHFFHTSIIHLLVNSWCLLCLFFACNTSLRALIVAYIIATCTPIFWDTPTLGLSAMLYALLGMQSWRARDKRTYHSFISVSLLFGILLPSVNGWIHLYAYIAGILAGATDRLVKWQRRKRTTT